MKTHMPVIDAHQHFWDLSTTTYPWMTDEMAVIRRSFLPEDLKPLLEEAGVDYTVLVQTRSSLQETRDFLDIAERTPFVAGVVGWVDFMADDVAGPLRDLKSGPA